MNQFQQSQILLKEAENNFRSDLKLTRIILVCFGVLSLLIRYLLKVPIPLEVTGLLGLWFLCYLGYPYLLKLVKNLNQFYNLYFAYNFGDLIFLTFLIHYLAGVEWIGSLFYILTLALAGTLLPKSKSLALSLSAALLYSLLAFSEYLGIIPHHQLFLLRPGLYRDFGYVFSQILTIWAFFYFVGRRSGTFAEQLREKRRQLIEEQQKTKQALQQVEEARKILEIKVKARTKELRELVEKREQIIEQRTKELQEKVDQLEKFRKLAVGRELKMIELKKTLRQAQDKIKELKKQYETD